MPTIGITERGDAAVHYDELREDIDALRRGVSPLNGVILITKDPETLFQELTAGLPQHRSLKRTPCIIHCTITGWARSVLEPGVPPLKHALEYYHRFVAALGPQRVVLRVDPILPTREGIEKAKQVLRKAESRVRISFLDAYPHVRKRLNETKHPISLPWEETHAPLEMRKHADEVLFGSDPEERSYRREICGEPGMTCSGCVSVQDFKALNLPIPTNKNTSTQRNACTCLSVKKELLSHREPCRHSCLYCYWKGETV